MKKAERMKDIIQNFGIIFILIIVLIIFGLGNPAFATVSNVITIIKQASIVCISSVGMLFVLLTGGIDLSVGYIASAVGMISAILMTEMQVHPVLACLVAFAFAMAVGFVQGMLIAKIDIPPFIVTMAFMSVLKGFSYLTTDGKTVYGLPEKFMVIGQGDIGPIPISIILMVVALVIGGVILRKTYFGRYYYAIGGNEEAARLSGINVDRVKVSTYMISAFYAFFAGIVMLSRISTAAPNIGDGFEFDVITACVLGGVSMTGGSGKEYQVFVGAMIIAALNNGLIIMHVSTYVQLVLKGAILLAAVAVDCIQKSQKEKAIHVSMIGAEEKK